MLEKVKRYSYNLNYRARNGRYYFHRRVSLCAREECVSQLAPGQGLYVSQRAPGKGCVDRGVCGQGCMDRGVNREGVNRRGVHPPRRPLKQAVRILMECILNLKLITRHYFHLIFCYFICASKYNFSLITIVIRSQIVCQPRKQSEIP